MHKAVRLFLYLSLCATSLAQSAWSADKPFPHLSWKDSDNDAGLEIGGALRANYRYEDWNTSIYRNPPRLRFDTVRVDASGYYQKLFFDAGFWFQDKRKYIVDRAFVGWRFNPQNNIQVGLPGKPFGLQPFPQFGWTFGVPFYMGFAMSAGGGIKYQYQNNDWSLDAAWFPWMEPGGARFAPDVGDYTELTNTMYASQGLQRNEKRDQVNLRLARTFKEGGWNNELGGSLAASRLYNNETGDNGMFWAAGLHGVANYGPWKLTTQVIRYSYSPKNPPGVSDDSILMGGNGLNPAYLIPAKATTGALNLARDVDVTWGAVKKLRFYNDFSVLWKDKRGWSDSQINTLGVQVFALPVMFWVDMSWAKNANPWGGSLSSTGWTSTSSPGSNKWYLRTNVNIGYYF